MSERDPRIDPKPGDRFKKTTRMREVVSAQQGIVRYVLESGRNSMTIEDWRKWARNAEVIKRAE